MLESAMLRVDPASDFLLLGVYALLGIFINDSHCNAIRLMILRCSNDRCANGEGKFGRLVPAFSFEMDDFFPEALGFFEVEGEAADVDSGWTIG